MPGIVGLITQMPRERALRAVPAMVEALRHESFYTTGTWVEQSLGVYVGWVARKGSFSDGMPLRNERGDVVLVFSGEEFPEPGTAQRLTERGHDFDGPDATYLVHLYEEDPSFPAGLNGRFHGLLTDRNRGTAVLFNDRYGMHRIYYHESKDAFYFAAEAKAILAVRPELSRMDPRARESSSLAAAVLENRTLFRGRPRLAASIAWVFRNGSLEQKSSYFDPEEWERPRNTRCRNPTTGRFERSFTRNLPRYFMVNQRIAMS